MSNNNKYMILFLCYSQIFFISHDHFLFVYKSVPKVSYTNGLDHNLEENNTL